MCSSASGSGKTRPSFSHMNGDSFRRKWPCQRCHARASRERGGSVFLVRWARLLVCSVADMAVWSQSIISGCERSRTMRCEAEALPVRSTEPMSENRIAVSVDAADVLALVRFQGRYLDLIKRCHAEVYGNRCPPNQQQKALKIQLPVARPNPPTWSGWATLPWRKDGQRGWDGWARWPTNRYIRWSFRNDIDWRKWR